MKKKLSEASHHLSVVEPRGIVSAPLEIHAITDILQRETKRVPALGGTPDPWRSSI